MAIIIETKFDVGAVVWSADTQGVKRRHPCPDCLEQRSWQAISPAGRGYTFECPRCSRNHISDRALDLSFWTYEPHVHALTLVAFRGVGERGGEWFAAETSSGGPGSNRSGTIHCEDRLFATETEALEVARRLCFDAIDRHQAQPKVAEDRALRLRVCDYQMDQAKNTADQRRLWSYQWKVDDFLTAIEQSDEPAPDWIKALVVEHFPGREQ